jgi:hypothetical protein
MCQGTSSSRRNQFIIKLFKVGRHPNSENKQVNNLVEQEAKAVYDGRKSKEFKKLNISSSYQAHKWTQRKESIEAVARGETWEKAKSHQRWKPGSWKPGRWKLGRRRPPEVEP